MTTYINNVVFYVASSSKYDRRRRALNYVSGLYIKRREWKEIDKDKNSKRELYYNLATITIDMEVLKTW